MKLKRMAFMLTAAVIALASVFAGCTPKVDPNAELVSISIDKNGLKTEYTVGDKFNPDSVTFTANYDSGAKQTVKITAEGVTYTPNPLTFDEVGEKTLNVSYTVKEVTKSDSVKFTVVAAPEEYAELDSFGLPTAYATYQAKYKNDPDESTQNDSNMDTFMVGGGTYKVGNINGFVFIPDATAWNADDEKVIVTDVDTTLKLYIANETATYTEVSDTTEYVTVKDQPNVYYFTEKAEGHTFKLEITVDEDGKYDPSNLTAAQKTITAEIEVVKGYNVYNQDGLSVFDNMNKKHWAPLKDKTLDWDTKKLSEYDDVELIVIHNNITIDPDYLPDYYFWDSTRTGVEQGYDSAYGNTPAQKIFDEENKDTGSTYQDKFDGSLRDWSPSNKNGGSWFNFDAPSNGDYTEDYNPSRVNMQKAIYNTSGCSIQGNCMQIDYLLEGSKHKLYSVYDPEGDSANKGAVSPLSHWSLFKHVAPICFENNLNNYAKYKNSEITIENLRILGQMPRKAKTDGDPAQLMGFTSAQPSNIKNCLMSQLFVALTGDHTWADDGMGLEELSANVHITDSKITDIYSNMFYLWRATITVNHSVLTKAGGPIFLLVDGSHSNNPANDASGPRLVADEASTIESWAAGYEPWYTINNANALFTSIHDQIAYLLNQFFGLTIIENKDGAEQINVIAAIIPDPGDLMSEFTGSDMLNVNGMVTRGDSENYYMNPSVPIPEYQAMVAYLLSTNAPVFASGAMLGAYAGNTEEEGHHIISTYPSGLIEAKTGNETAVNLATIRGAWTASAKEWLLMTMRATAKSPRFGVLVGDVKKVTA